MNVIKLTDDQIKSLVKLINDEMATNKSNDDEAYNTHWENVKMALGYAVIH